jgi:hypothetical protein
LRCADLGEGNLANALEETARPAVKPPIIRKNVLLEDVREVDVPGDGLLKESLLEEHSSGEKVEQFGVEVGI